MREGKVQVLCKQVLPVGHMCVEGGREEQRPQRARGQESGALLDSIFLDLRSEKQGCPAVSPATLHSVLAQASSRPLFYTYLHLHFYYIYLYLLEIS
jgi:hypothetical protein